MKKELFNGVNCKIPMNLQFFAKEGESAGGGSGTEGAGTDPEGGNKPPEKKSFDEVLSDTEYQAEFDRRVQKALETQKAKLEIFYDDKVSEAEKLAKMNKKEKNQYLQKKQEKALEERERAITKRELMAEAKNTLAEKKLPVHLAEILNYTDADSCKKSITAVEKAFREAVEVGVQDQLKGSVPPKKAQTESNLLEKQIEALMMGR
ncbi:MAG: DUF4355 domain-containing protein [Clostridiales bacterium]|nr:DUF4355 domain-containing protein [Clostridiales bacterium]